MIDDDTLVEEVAALLYESAEGATEWTWKRLLEDAATKANEFAWLSAEIRDDYRKWAGQAINYIRNADSK